MLLKDVKAGGVYAMLSWGGRELRHEFGSFGAGDWERVGEKAVPVEVLAVGVKVDGYKRPGVRLRYLDRDSMEPVLLVARGERGQPVAGPPTLHEGETLAATLIAPWDELRRGYIDFLDAANEQRAAAAAERALVDARRQEEAARDWMQRHFAEARRDIEQVMEVVNGEPGRTADDDEVRALVDLRNPDGNPYLNGERKAF